MDVERVDAHTHVLVPSLTPRVGACEEGLGLKTVSFGRLAPGEHRVLVKNVARPARPARFWVAEETTQVAVSE